MLAATEIVPFCVILLFEANKISPPLDKLVMTPFCTMPLPPPATDLLPVTLRSPLPASTLSLPKYTGVVVLDPKLVPKMVMDWPLIA